MSGGSLRRRSSIFARSESKILNLRPRRKRSGETRYESALRDRLKDHAVWFIKLKPTVTGFPDRIALQAPGRKLFVELKGLTGKLSDAQLEIHEELRELGSPVLRLYKARHTVDDAVTLILHWLRRHG